jgi:peptidyl-prolyl cis-trans isomerase A (cyclophilin A)
LIARPDAGTLAPGMTNLLPIALLFTAAACAPSAEREPAAPREGEGGGAVDIAVPEPQPGDTGAPRSTAPAAEIDAATALLDPSLPQSSAPPEFRVRFETTKGNFDLRCVREWAPHGVDRFHHLVRIGFYRDSALFRVVSGFVVQFGIHANPTVSAAWKKAKLPVDEVRHPNAPGTVSFAMAAEPTSRTTQIFINLTDNSRLDTMGFAPICEIVGDGLTSTVSRFFSGYGDKLSSKQGRIEAEGNGFLRAEFPDLDYVIDARLLDGR